MTDDERIAAARGYRWVWSLGLAWPWWRKQRDWIASELGQAHWRAVGNLMLSAGAVVLLHVGLQVWIGFTERQVAELSAGLSARPAWVGPVLLAVTVLNVSAGLGELALVLLVANRCRARALLGEGPSLKRRR